MKLKWFLSNDKAEKTTLLEDNTKIKTGERSSSIKLLLIC